MTFLLSGRVQGNQAGASQSLSTAAPHTVTQPRFCCHMPPSSKNIVGKETASHLEQTRILSGITGSAKGCHIKIHLVGHPRRCANHACDAGPAHVKRRTFSSLLKCLGDSSRPLAIACGIPVAAQPISFLIVASLQPFPASVGGDHLPRPWAR